MCVAMSMRYSPFGLIGHRWVPEECPLRLHVSGGHPRLCHIEHENAKEQEVLHSDFVLLSW